MAYDDTLPIQVSLTGSNRTFGLPASRARRAALRHRHDGAVFGLIGIQSVPQHDTGRAKVLNDDVGFAGNGLPRCLAIRRPTRSLTPPGALATRSVTVRSP